jgi:small subunit ribosomal protein S6
MPRYELTYLLGNSVSDDQLETVIAEILSIVESFGAKNIETENLGKKKLAYAIKQTKNGTYVTMTFDLPQEQVQKLDAKIRTMKNTVIRYLMINITDHLKRLAKDKIIQANLPKRENQEEEKAVAPESVVEEKAEVAEPAKEISLDEQIDEALNVLK